MPRHHVIAFLDFDLQRAKATLVDRLRWHRQSLLSDQRPPPSFLLPSRVEVVPPELQTRQPRTQGVRRRKTRAQAADIGPVGSRRRESEQLAPFEPRRVYQYVVQVLPTDALVIGDDH